MEVQRGLSQAQEIGAALHVQMKKAGLVTFGHGGGLRRAQVR